MNSWRLKQALQLDEVFADFPRAAWAGRVLLVIEGKELERVGVGSCMIASNGRKHLNFSVLETPFMRYPAPDMKALHTDGSHWAEIEALMRDGDVTMELESDG